MIQAISYCQDFTEKFSQLKTEFESSDFENLIRKYTQGSEKAGDVYQERLQFFQEHQANLVEGYQNTVRDLLEIWFEEARLEADSSQAFKKAIDFDDQQRVIVKGDIKTHPISGEVKASYFPSVIKTVTGSVDLGIQNLREIDFLEEVGDSLNISFNQNLVSIKRLRKVGDNFHCIGTNVESFDSLEETGGMFSCIGVENFKSAPKLRKIGGIMQIQQTPITNFRDAFPMLEKVNGTIVISEPLRAEVEALKAELGSPEISVQP